MRLGSHHLAVSHDQPGASTDTNPLGTQVVGSPAMYDCTSVPGPFTSSCRVRPMLKFQFYAEFCLAFPVDGFTLMGHKFYGTRASMQRHAESMSSWDISYETAMLCQGTGVEFEVNRRVQFVNRVMDAVESLFCGGTIGGGLRRRFFWRVNPSSLAHI